jgi:hypothetical protein
MRLLIAILLFATAIASADDSREESLQLRIKPVLCITDSRNPSCDMAFLVVWESADSGYYCLFNDLQDSSLRCWQEVRVGELVDERTVDQSFSFWMTGEDLASRLAQVDVEVLRMDSDDRRRRRRTRHVWDIN